MFQFVNHNISDKFSNRSGGFKMSNRSNPQSKNDIISRSSTSSSIFFGNFPF